MLTSTRERSLRLDDYATALGRDPRTIRRSFVFVTDVNPKRPGLQLTRSGIS
jgi:hypothetical protein